MLKALRGGQAAAKNEGIKPGLVDHQGALVTPIGIQDVTFRDILGRSVAFGRCPGIAVAKQGTDILENKINGLILGVVQGAEALAAKDLGQADGRVSVF